MLMSKKTIRIILLVVLAIVFARAIMNVSADKTTEIVGNNIAVINFEGAIMESETFIGKLEKLEDNANIVGVIIRVNSPGGAVTPSNEIYDYILTMEKPVYIAMGSVAASGGYMMALGGDKIYAMPSTITGSIGVIMNMVNTEELFDKVGVKSVVIASGKFKDTGSPTRPMRADERELLDGIVDSMYQQFADIVAKRRNMKIEDVYKVADGRIMTGQQAIEAGLVDNLGSWRDAYVDLSASLNLPDIQMYEVKDKKEWWEEYLGASVKDLFSKFQVKSGVYYMLENW